MAEERSYWAIIATATSATGTTDEICFASASEQTREEAIAAFRFVHGEFNASMRLDHLLASESEIAFITPPQ